MTRHRVIIQRLGGHVALAEQLGLDVETVRSWRKWDRGIPARHWVQIAKLSGLTPEYLQRTSPRLCPPRQKNGR
jgi:DNA-binding transcriptional regulator YdaS (Cro superfamily)